MSIIITNDIEQECSNLISMYTDVKYVKKRLLQSYPGLSTNKQTTVPKKVKSFVDQANSFLNETDDNILTAPLTLFYAMQNYAKAVFLVNFPNLSLANSHGLDFDNEVANNVDELGLIKCKVTNKGTFTNLISVTGDVLSPGDEVILYDVFSVVPELREVFFARYFKEPNLFLLKEKKNSFAEFTPILQGKLTDEIRNRDYSILLANGFHFEFSEKDARVWVDGNFTLDKLDNVIYLDVYGNKYLTNAITVNEKSVKLSKMVSMYLAYYCFSMLVRYNPEKWTEFCQSSDVAIIRKLLLTCRREMLVEVLQLLNGEKYIFSTKMEEFEPDVNAQELFKIIKKEAESYFKRTGKSPFLF